MKQNRCCGICRSTDTALLEDTPSQRLYECRSCFAVEVITKGSKTPAWWYHGWEHPDGRRVNADGRREMRPAHMAFGWWDRNRTTRAAP